MAAGYVWLPWARVAAPVAVEGAPHTAAVTYDDGAAGQRPRATRTRYRRSIVVELGPSDRMTAFRAWAEVVDAGPFAWRDKSDGVTRQVRIEGGAAGVRYRQVRDQPGPLWWTAELTLEDAV